MPKYPPYNQPFDEQLAFFRQKLNLPTARWDDITLAAHDRAFIVAGAQGADLLEDLRGAVDEAIQQGTGLEAFRKNFARNVAEHGWTGWTGEGTPGGVAWRTKVIYQTNMAASYSAGRRMQLSDPELLKILPYWKFHHNDSVQHPRPLHQSCDGLTLPPDHPFWNNTWPPVFDGEMAFGCQCWVSAVSKEKFMSAIANGKGPANIPAGIMIDENNVTAPGANWLKRLKDDEEKALLKFAKDKKDLLDAELAQAFARYIIEGLAYSIDNIVALISAGLLAVDAAKKLARLLPGFTQDMLAKIDAAQPADTPTFGERLIKQFKDFFDFGNPDQPRVPAGSSDGGEWTADGASGQTPALSVEERNKIAKSEYLYDKYGSKAIGGRGEFKAKARGGELDHLNAEYLQHEAEIAAAQKQAQKIKNQAWKDKHLPELVRQKAAREQAELDRVKKYYNDKAAEEAAHKAHFERTHSNAPSPQKTTEATPKPLQRVDTGRTQRRIVTADDPSIHGSHLLGREGEYYNFPVYEDK